MQIQSLSFAGTHSQIGEAVGRALKRQIASIVETYLAIIADSFNMKPDNSQFLTEMRRRAEQYQGLIRQLLPHYADEIEALALSSGIATWQIYFINARTEILSAGWSQDQPGECTLFAVPSQRIAGQTWDWKTGIAEQLALIEIQALDRPRCTMLVEPGIVGKFGMNASGVAVMLRILFGSFRGEIGIPVHLLLRSILECDSAAEAEALVRSMPRNTFSSVMILDSTGGFFNLEMNGQDLLSVQSQIGTNHFCGIEQSNPLVGSVQRFETAGRLLPAINTVEQLKAAVTDTSGSGQRICRFPAPSVHFEVETAAAVAFELSENWSDMHIIGRPHLSSAVWQHYRLNRV